MVKRLFSLLAEWSGMIVEFAGLASIVTGVALVCVPAAFIVGGVLGIVAMQAATRAQGVDPIAVELKRQWLARQRAA